MYKFREEELVNELKAYIDSTYGQHYAQDKLQATEVIADAGHGEGFILGNKLKYIKRYGKKTDDPQKWRSDLMKDLHYGILMLYLHDKKHG